MDRAWRVVEKAHRKFHALKTARDAKALKINRSLTALQERMLFIQRKEIEKRVSRVRMKVNRAVPHLKISVPVLRENQQ